MPIPPELDALIQALPGADQRNDWHYDTAGEIVRNLLEKEPRYQTAPAEELKALIQHILHADHEYGGTSTKLNGDSFTITGRDIRGPKNTWQSSPDIPGLFPNKEVPSQPQAHQDAEDAINRMLASLGHKVKVKASEQVLSYKQSYPGTTFTLETPERKGTYTVNGYYTHKPQAERDKQTRELVDLIILRIANKRHINNARKRVEEDVGRYIATIEGMRLVGSIYHIDTYNTRKHGEIRGTAYAQIEVIGDALTPRIVSATIDEKAKYLRAQISRHKKNFAILKAGPRTESMTCEPILAAAIRAVAAEHGKGILYEIESLLEGHHRNPSNPRRRGIANFSMKNGLLSAPVTLQSGKKNRVRFMNGRLSIESIMQLPKTVLDSLPGQAMTAIAEHPYLEGLTIKSATVNSIGLNLRPEPAPLPLTKILEELRTAIAAAPDKPAKKKRS